MDVPPIHTIWISAFLHNRQRRVQIGPVTSSWLQMNGGVLQGTKLGVPLFVIMINELKTRNATPTFMDDTTRHETKPLIGPCLLQKSINMDIDWSGNNDMQVNPTKTKYLHVNFSKQKEGSQDLYIDGKYLEKQNVVKSLGVHIQKDLKWDSHVNAIVKKARQKLRIISVLKWSGHTEPELLQVYISLIRAILEYACEVWHPGLTLSQVHGIE